MMTVKDVSRLTGVSVRALQYYDQIGLLRATAYTEAGYRLYDGVALARLQQILLFRELEFSLKDIKSILSRPNFDQNAALRQQITLLQMKKAHIEKLIDLAYGITKTGGTYMDFSAFDTSKLDAYAQEAKAQWGHTEAYAEFEKKSAGRDEATQDVLGKGLMEIFAQMGKIKQAQPTGKAAQALVQALQDYITRHYYHCTKPILMGLGQMYASGGAFTDSIDAVGGAGTAAFAQDAITAYCK